MNNIHWSFPSTGGGPLDGIHNPLISHFTGDFNYHLAREIIQNSLDAKLNEHQPVVVKFNLLNFDKRDFPGYEEIEEVLKECIKLWPKENKDTHDFLHKAKKCLENKTLTILKCSDYNTIGLDGKDDDLNGSWFNLVKSRGASSKYKGEGGSYGIGKGAPFAASELRSVFYNTKNKNAWSIFQGLCELVSFKKDNDIKRGNGSYGIDGQHSIRIWEEIPEIFRRKPLESSGLDVFIMGFRKSDKWQDELMVSVLRNFWYAVMKKELVVEIDDIILNHTSLEKHLLKHFAGEKLKDDIEPIGNPSSFYYAVKSGLKFTDTLTYLGEVEFYFKELHEHMNHTAMLRRPHMVVFSKAYHFPGSYYCGVFICNSKEGNQILRKMEPPAHNKWEPESYGPEGFKILNEIHVWIRKILKSQQSIKPKGELEIPDLYKYLPYDEGSDEGDGSGMKDYTDKESETESSKERQKKEEDKKEGVIKPYKITVTNKKEKTGLGGNLRGDKKKKKSKHKGGLGVGDIETPNKEALTSPEIILNSFVSKSTAEGFEYIFNIKSDKERNCKIQIQSVGDDDSNEDIQILQVKDETGSIIQTSGNKIQHLKFSSQKENKIYVQIKSKVKIALKTLVYEL